MYYYLYPLHWDFVAFIIFSRYLFYFFTMLRHNLLQNICIRLQRPFIKRFVLMNSEAAFSTVSVLITAFSSMVFLASSVRKRLSLLTCGAKGIMLFKLYEPAEHAWSFPGFFRKEAVVSSYFGSNFDMSVIDLSVFSCCIVKVVINII